MPETRQDLEQQLQFYEQEKKANEDAIRETMLLLKKADKRLTANPEERSKWGRTLDNLEGILSEKKRYLTTSKTNIIQVTRKLEQGQYSSEEAESAEPDHSPEPEPQDDEEPLSIPENLTLDDLKEAARRILAIHIIQVHSISDLDFKLAKALVDSGSIQFLSHEDTVELRKRLNILEKSRGGVPHRAVLTTAEETHDTTPPSSTSNGNVQHHVQSALHKCAEQQYGSITIEELEVLAKYGQALSLKNSSSTQHILQLIQESLSAIQQRVSHIPFDN